MDACHILLESPWQYNVQALHNRCNNTSEFYQVDKKLYGCLWVPHKKILKKELLKSLALFLKEFTPADALWGSFPTSDMHLLALPNIPSPKNQSYIMDHAQGKITKERSVFVPYLACSKLIRQGPHEEFGFFSSFAFTNKLGCNSNSSIWFFFSPPFINMVNIRAYPKSR